ncbi:hypothetical protein [Streptomyces cupreus]|uniref:Uncharacterized protein n=1 Tax=Streptomyces cupreus TaxID=2759956 RepID=A0A7X1J5Z2_9ACTN|nr:hypothetical protein [Streptomyces cupreus]MBC2904833.1 hypothetical protein [Streptomyces cupreus]
MVSLRSRRSNIPRKQLELRTRLCRELGIEEVTLPFAGELIQVREDEQAWAGAAERLLRGFALSLLVPGDQYGRVSGWINDHHLGTKLVYFRVPDKLPPRRSQHTTSTALFTKLEVRQDSPFAQWLAGELERLASHECTETMEDFRRADLAITRQGLIKGARGRHEKNDTTRIDDRSSYVLGWTNQAKIDALLDRAGRVHAAQRSLAEKKQALAAAHEDSISLDKVLAQLAAMHDYSEIDWRAAVRHITELNEEKQRLEAASKDLDEISRRLEDIAKEIAEKEDACAKADKALGRLSGEMETAVRARDAARALLDESAAVDARTHFPAVEQRLTEAHLQCRTADECARVETRLREDLTAAKTRWGKEQTRLAQSIASQMGTFRTRKQAGSPTTTGQPVWRPPPRRRRSVVQPPLFTVAQPPRPPMRPPTCPRCQKRPAISPSRRRYCHQCAPGGPLIPPPCRRCGSMTGYYSAGLCARCHKYAPQQVDSCLDCLAWGVTRTTSWLCQGCRAWRRNHPRTGTCRTCQRTLALRAGICRLLQQPATGQT